MDPLSIAIRLIYFVSVNVYLLLVDSFGCPDPIEYVFVNVSVALTGHTAAVDFLYVTTNYVSC